MFDKFFVTVLGILFSRNLENKMCQIAKRRKAKNNFKHAFFR